MLDGLQAKHITSQCSTVSTPGMWHHLNMWDIWAINPNAQKLFWLHSRQTDEGCNKEPSRQREMAWSSLCCISSINMADMHCTFSVVKHAHIHHSSYQWWYTHHIVQSCCLCHVKGKEKIHSLLTKVMIRLLWLPIKCRQLQQSA